MPSQRESRIVIVGRLAELHFGRPLAHKNIAQKRPHFRVIYLKMIIFKGAQQAHTTNFSDILQF